MLAAGDRDIRLLPQLGIAVEVVGEECLLDPREPVRFKALNHFFRIEKIPAHVGVGHDLDVVADRIAHVGDVFLVGSHAVDAVAGPVGETHFHRLVPLRNIGLGLGRDLVRANRVQCRGVHGDVRLHRAAKKLVDRLVGRLAGEIPQGEVDRAERLKRHALATVR